MKRLSIGIVILAIGLLAGSSVASAQEKPTFKLGFQTIADQISETVGEPLENEHFTISNGNSEQHTSKGLMAWRKVDNWTAFTNGYMTWINGPDGLQIRLNDERFPWEKDPVAVAPVPPQSAPAPAPVPPQSAPTPAAPSAPAAGTDWTSYDKSADGFKISLPPTWQQIDLNSQDIAGEFRRVFKDYPIAAADIQSCAVGATLVKLQGGVFLSLPVNQASASQPMGVAGKILRTEVPVQMTLNDVVTLGAARLDGAVAEGSISRVAHRRVTLPAGEAEEFAYVQKVKLGLAPEVAVGIIDYVFVHKGATYDLVFVVLPDRADELKPVLDGMVKSFQFTDSAQLPVLKSGATL